MPVRWDDPVEHDPTAREPALLLADEQPRRHGAARDADHLRLRGGASRVVRWSGMVLLPTMSNGLSNSAAPSVLVTGLATLLRRTPRNSVRLNCLLMFSAAAFLSAALLTWVSGTASVLALKSFWNRNWKPRSSFASSLSSSRIRRSALGLSLTRLQPP